MPATRMIDSPGLYRGIPNELYHRDIVLYGSLSSTEVRAMLECPAIFHWAKHNRRPDTRFFDYGHAAHTRVLGTGVEIDVYPEPGVKDRRTKRVQEWERKVREAGRVPLLQHEADMVEAMELQLRHDPKAAPLVDPDLGGEPEVVGVAQDPATGVWLRTMVDWLPPGQIMVDWLPPGQIMVDYKTMSMPPTLDNIRRAIATRRYHVQAAHNLKVLWLAGHPVDPLTTRFLLIFQWVKPPYIVTTVDLELPAIQRGLELQERALRRYVECREYDWWPGYTDDLDTIPTVGLPPWADRDDQEDREDFQW
jgi:hypothetical protein